VCKHVLCQAEIAALVLVVVGVIGGTKVSPPTPRLSFVLTFSALLAIREPFDDIQTGLTAT